MPSDPLTGPYTDCLVPWRRITPELAAKQNKGGRKPRQCFGGMTYQVLPTSKDTTHAELYEWLQDDILFNNWLFELLKRGYETFGLLPLQKTKAEPPHSEFCKSEKQIKEYKTSADAIHKAFETYKDIIRKYKILGPEFLKTEVRRAETWQHILVDLSARFEDLLVLASILTGKHHEWPLQLPFLKNVWHAWSWLKVCWREINSAHVFLVRNFAEDDGTFGELREPAPQLRDGVSSISSESAEDASLSRTRIRAKVSVQRTDSVLSKVKRIGSKMRR